MNEYLNRFLSFFVFNEMYFSDNICNFELIYVQYFYNKTAELRKNYETFNINDIYRPLQKAFKNGLIKASKACTFIYKLNITIIRSNVCHFWRENSNMRFFAD